MAFITDVPYVVHYITVDYNYRIFLVGPKILAGAEFANNVWKLSKSLPGGVPIYSLCI